MSEISLQTFEIFFQANFDNIPEDMEKIIINVLYNNYGGTTSFLDNLPVSVKEIRFNNKNYFFNIPATDNNYYTVHKLKIPFGCKIYKFEKEILDFDGLIYINSEHLRMNFNHPVKELLWLNKII